MAGSSQHDAWQAGDSYDLYMGRWSRQVAPIFLDWLDAPGGLSWLDVGCGTGALSASILARCKPKSLISVDPSDGFLDKARHNVPDERIEFRLGYAQSLPIETASRDVVVSGLVLNFVTDRPAALAEMKRVGRRGATVGFYVWDYPGRGLEFLRAFWDAATFLDPKAQDLTENRRFPFCTPEQLTELVTAAGLQSVECTSIEVPTLFKDFDDYWTPFTLGAGPAPGYCTSLASEPQERLRRKLKDSIPTRDDGSIALKAKAWALKGVAP